MSARYIGRKLRFLLFLLRQRAKPHARAWLSRVQGWLSYARQHWLPHAKGRLSQAQDQLAQAQGRLSQARHDYSPHVRNRLSQAWKWLRERGALLERRLHGESLLSAVLVVLAVVVCVGSAILFFFYHWFEVSENPVPSIEVTKVALAVVAGFGGVVALTVAYRKQRDVEQGRFIERFGAAAAQLGSPDAAVRIAGVYAMAVVADESSGSRRQQCIDVLCGYLRLPYSPEQGKNHQSKLVRKQKSSDEESASAEETEEHFEYRRDDSEVRKTICRVIRQHLLKEAVVSWSASDFDFTGVCFEELDFQEVVFSGGQTSFAGARFENKAIFEYASFRGGNVSFSGVEFRKNCKLSFGEANFEAVEVSFEETNFYSIYTEFSGSVFRGCRALFSGAVFDGEVISFNSVAFQDSKIHFDETKFGSKYLNFTDTDFRDGMLLFYKSEFSGESVSFKRARFDSGFVSFEEAQVRGGVQFEWDNPIRGNPGKVNPDQWPPVFYSPDSSSGSSS